MVATADPTRWTPEEVAAGRAAYPAPADPASEHATSAYNPTPGARPPPARPRPPPGARGPSSSSGPAGSVSAGPASRGAVGARPRRPPPAPSGSPGCPGTPPSGKSAGPAPSPSAGTSALGRALPSGPQRAGGSGGRPGTACSPPPWSLEPPADDLGDPRTARPAGHLPCLSEAVPSTGPNPAEPADEPRGRRERADGVPAGAAEQLPVLQRRREVQAHHLRRRGPILR